MPQKIDPNQPALIENTGNLPSQPAGEEIDLIMILNQFSLISMLSYLH